METCFSLELYYKVWNYLFMDTKGSTNNLAPITKAYEIFKFIKLMKPVLSGELILEKALKNRVACNNTKGKMKKVRDIPQIDDKSRLYLFKDYNGAVGVRVYNDKGRNKFGLEELKNYCEPKYYERLMKKYNKTKHKLKRERLTLDVMQLKEVMRKEKKENRSKAVEKLKWDKRENENMCMIHALKCMNSVFKGRKYLKEFDGLDLKQSIDKANEILSSQRLKIVEVEQKKQIVNRYVAANKGQKLIVFWFYGADIHAEAINGNECIKKPQPHIVRLMSYKCDIKAFEIIRADPNGAECRDFVDITIELSSEGTENRSNFDSK